MKPGEGATASAWRVGEAIHLGDSWRAGGPANFKPSQSAATEVLGRFIGFYRAIGAPT